ncbi:PfkB family carbohydrate kinase [Geminicoccus sp.]|uniref:PfkB family carbohydrate kinase n=1 Tax=Geminicoccus sp. TaxID=2024832 RepID=UPI0032C23003
MGYSLVGGNAVNVAVQLAMLGRTSAYFGAVGDDAPGRRTIDALGRAGVITDHVQVLPRVTAYTIIEVDANGERRIGFEEFGACAVYEPTEADMEVLARARHVHIGWFPLAPRWKNLLREAAVPVSQDLAVNKGDGPIDIAFDSAGEDRARAEQLLARALAGGARLAVITMGALGAIAGDGGPILAIDALPLTPVDTTGAGDSFIAGFLDAHLSGKNVQASLAAGRDAAAKTCLHPGGFPQPLERL